MKIHRTRFTIAYLLLASAFLCVRSYEYHHLYKPEYQEVYTPKTFHLSYQDVFFDSPDGIRLHGWWIPGQQQKAPIIMLCHGQGGNISDRLIKANCWHELGAHVFLFDYRGYGKSAGTPSENGLYNDGDAAYNWVHQRASGNNLFIYGASLGGGVATEMALRHPVSGLILEDTFTSIEDMARYRFANLPVGWLLSTSFNNLAKISKVTIPILIFHSSADEVIPFEMGRRLFEAARTPKYFTQLSGLHENAYSVSSATYKLSLKTFLKNTK